jgi:hypothetical protein
MGINRAPFQVPVPNTPVIGEFTQEEMAQVMHTAFTRMQALRDAGQKEYAHGPAFGNFNRLAKKLHLPREKVLWVYLAKHLDGIEAFLNGHSSQREDVIGRIDDARVYLTLLEGMITEDRRNAYTQRQLAAQGSGQISLSESESIRPEASENPQVLQHIPGG